MMSQEEANQQSLNVEVAHATPKKQLVIQLRVPQGTTALEAINLSKILDEFPGIKLEKDTIGIFSKPLDGKARHTPDQCLLQDLDRVEIYRPLLIDPKKPELSGHLKKQA
jgi:uncharacterized protein